MGWKAHHTGEHLALVLRILILSTHPDDLDLGLDVLGMSLPRTLAQEISTLGFGWLRHPGETERCCP